MLRSQNREFAQLFVATKQLMVFTEFLFNENNFSQNFASFHLINFCEILQKFSFTGNPTPK